MYCIIAWLDAKESSSCHNRGELLSIDKNSLPQSTSLIFLCLSVSSRGWNNRRETIEGICQPRPWLGSINVPLACFSTQTLETNSLPTQDSCLYKHWWIPVAWAANRVFISPFSLTFSCSLPPFHFPTLVSQLENQFSFQRELRSYSSLHLPLVCRVQNKSQVHSAGTIYFESTAVILRFSLHKNLKVHNNACSAACESKQWVFLKLIKPKLSWTESFSSI